MADDRAFRVWIAYDPKKESFVARVPELDIRATGPSRSEAVSEVEVAIEQRIAAAAVDHAALPDPVDAREVSGALTLRLADTVHREILFHARASGISPEEFASQLLSRAVGTLELGRSSRRRPEGRPDDGPPSEEASDTRAGAPRPGPREDRDERGGGRSSRAGRRREGYHADLDDKANFLEYLRGLEKGGGGQGGGRGRR